jgi:hypothetical protein
MESQIPLPTDNIYKFYALFGLLLFVFSVGAGIYETHSANEIVFQVVPEIEALKQMTNASPAEVAKKIVLERRYEIAVSDRKTMEWALTALMAIGAILIGFGFWMWQTKVQPIESEMAELQLKKLRHEVSLLTPPPVPPAEPPRQESSKPEAED